MLVFDGMKPQNLFYDVLSSHENNYWNAPLRILFAILFMWVITAGTAHAQTNIGELNPAQYFDFWVGTWELTWEDADGSTAYGSNHIEKILGGNVIKENFKASSGSYKGFVGKSFSVYNPRTEKWKQTWVDNEGGYLDFTGVVEGNKRIFKREGVNQEGEKILQRMVFYDITETSFTWDWQISEDNGQTWQLRWRIFYVRV